MSRRSFIAMGVVAAVIAIMSLAAGRAAGQTPTVPATKTTTAAKATAPGTKWTTPRTPDGRPDLQGIWNISTLTPLERPKERAGKETLTDQEAAALEQQNAKRVAQRNAASAPKKEAPPVGGNVGGYNNFWLDGGTTVATINGKKRTSLIVDPPDGRIPFLPEARKAQARASARYGVGPFSSFEDLDTGERCITDGIPWTPFAYNNNFQIVQAPGHFVIFREQYAELRVIPIDGRPPLGQAIRQWMGDSRGRWEGDTLVVDTMNFADKRSYEWANTWRAARPTLHVLERFTRVDEKTINYEFTIEDTATFTRPWTALVPMTRTDDLIFEYACHEGNIAIGNILRGARAQEADEPAKKGLK